ncbi:MAG: hemolysin family protein [Clostridia bacterium]|nr:hemolysin family protein [Clostridia bacterium]
MDTGDLSTIIALVFLVLCSAFFSASETAYTSLNLVRMKRMAADGDTRAAKVLKLAERYESLLSSILIGNNIVNILASSLATVLFVRALGNKGVTVSTLVITVVILLVGEVTPKNIAKEHAETIAMKFYPVLFALTKLFTPLNWLLGCWQKLIGKVVKPAEDRGYTEEELITIVEEAENEGGIDAHESELIKSAIEFTDVDVEEILTPRVEIQAMELGASDDEISDLFQESGYSRLPVYQETVDNIVGILHEKDFYANRGKVPVRELMSTPTYVMQNTKVSDLLKLLQKTKSHMAVVVDEYDGVQGIVTMEDILEELVGEIWDEHDEVVEEYRALPDGGYLVDGGANLDDMLELFDIHKEYDPVTVNGWVREELGRFPKAGDSFECDNLIVTVEKAEKRRATEVRVVPKPAEEDAEQA